MTPLCGCCNQDPPVTHSHDLDCDICCDCWLACVAASKAMQKAGITGCTPEKIENE